MPTLRSGLVIAGAYADKLRRAMFAQMKNELKEGKIKANDVAYSVAQLNRVLYKIFVENLKVDKGDVVRVNIDYDVEDSTIKWNWNSMKIEVFRRVSEEEIEGALKPIVQEAEEIVRGAVEYNVEKLGETEDGDHIYVLKLGENVVGAFEVIPIDTDFAYVKKGAATEPSPMVIEKIRIPIEEGAIDESIRRNIELFTSKAKYVERSEAEGLINYITQRVKKESG